VRVVGLVTYDGEEKTENGAGIPIIGHVSNFAEILNKNEAGQAILLETRRSKAWVNFVVSTCYREGCRLLILNPWEEYFNQPLTPIDEGAHTFFTMQVEPLENPFNRFLKRVVDIAVSLPVVVLVLPMLSLFVAIGHRIQAPGPLVYRQSRSGLRGRTFTIFKFRSMHHYEQPEGDNTTEQAKKRDTRIFPFGHFLRRTSLDEFPQFLNVLKGNMSLVGPRPHMPEHDELFKQLVEIYRTRHFVKPGITGLAQYRGYRGEITDPELLRERIRLDLEYINNWSIWLDLGLILRTATQVFIPPESAY
jgi:exopolysaccharide biosynthesis polyprenyl glycosylphosphotransferase